MTVNLGLYLNWCKVFISKFKDL